MPLGQSVEHVVFTHNQQQGIRTRYSVNRSRDGLLMLLVSSRVCSCFVCVFACSAFAERRGLAHRQQTAQSCGYVQTTPTPLRTHGLDRAVDKVCKKLPLYLYCFYHCGPKNPPPLCLQSACGYDVLITMLRGKTAVPGIK